MYGLGRSKATVVVNYSRSKNDAEETVRMILEKADVLSHYRQMFPEIRKFELWLTRLSINSVRLIYL